MGIKVMLLDGGPSDPLRLAFAHLFQKREGALNTDGTRGKAKYEANLVFAPGSANAKRVNEATATVCKEAWGDKWEDLFAELGADEKAVRNGNTKVDKAGNVYDGFEGNKYVTARNTTRPSVVDRNQSPLTEEDGKPYAGCYVNAEVEIWAQKPKPGIGRRVNVSLLGVQFVRDGDAFGSGATPTAPSAFPSLSTEDEKGESASSGSAKSSVFDD